MAKATTVRPEFSASAPLNDLEAGLIKAVEAGEDFTYRPADLKPGDHIRGPFLRALLLGLALRHSRIPPPLKKSEPVTVTPHGIRIKKVDGIQPMPSGATVEAPLLLIKDDLDLSGLAAPGGGVLPLLELNDCDFEGRLSLAGARFQALAMSGSRFRHLDASGGYFGDSVSIKNCRPRKRPADSAEAFFSAHELAAFDADRERREGVWHGYTSRGLDGGSTAIPPADKSAPEPTEAESQLCCTLNFQFATIEGGVAIEECYFRAAGIVGRAGGCTKLHDALAVNFSRIRIGRSLLIKQTTIIGFVKAPSANIEQDLAVRGGKFLVSMDTAALDLQLARVGGKLSFLEGRPTESERLAGIRAFPVIVLGQIWGIGLSAGEVWIGEGLFYGSDAKRLGARPTLYFSKVNIATTFKIGAYHSFHTVDPQRPTAGALVQGEICLLAANLGKNLEVHGLKSLGIRNALNLDNAFFTAFGCAVAPEEFVRFVATGLHVDRRAEFSDAHLRDFSRPEIPVPAPPKHLSVPKPAALDLWKSKVGIGIRINHNCEFEGAIRLNSCVIGREVIIDCKSVAPSPRPENTLGGEIIPWLIDLRESTIDGQLKIGRRGQGRTVEVHGGITLENAKVQGRLLMRQLVMDLRQCPPAGDPGGKREDMRYRVALNLRDFECGSDLEVDGLRWRLPRAEEPAWRPFLRNPWSWTPRGFSNIKTGWYAVVDLRGLRCGLLLDDFGDGWGLDYRLQLLPAGMKVGEAEAGSHDTPEEWRRRLKWLSFQSRLQSRESHSAAKLLARPHDFNPFGWNDRLKQWGRRVWWAFWGARRSDFVSQAYIAFSAASHRAGDKEAAEAIAIEKKNIANYIHFKKGLRSIWSGWGGILRVLLTVATMWAIWYWDPREWTRRGSLFVLFIVIFWPIISAAFQSVFRGAFRYGLAPDRALLALLACVIVGWGGVYWARTGLLDPAYQVDPATGRLHPDIALVLEVPYAPMPTPAEATAAKQSSDSHSKDKPKLRLHSKALVADPSPCDLAVSSLLYAVDIFIPMLHLDQEERCSIREDHIDDREGDLYLKWRILKAIYEVIGWIITSLVILTVTGVLRRDLEPAQDLPPVELSK